MPVKTFLAVVDALIRMLPDLAPLLARFSEVRAERISRLSSPERINLALQKETLAVALDITGREKDRVVSWSPGAHKPRTFLEGLSQVRVREDTMLSSDFDKVPGFVAVTNATHYATKTFEDSADDPRIRLTVIMANRAALEEQTGADLIYYNATFKAFVFVQYKAMEDRGDRGPEFRWTAGDKLHEEIARMDAMLAELAKVTPDKHPDGFRLTGNPFFLKFCPRVIFNPDDKSLFTGFYLPLDLWKSLAASGNLTGPRGGCVISFENVGRRLTNTDFITLVATSWVGTTMAQSEFIELFIEEVLKSGKTITFAIKQALAPPVEPQPEAEPADLFFDPSKKLTRVKQS
jgi:hypothetical protein